MIMVRARFLAPLILLAMTGCADMLAQDRAIKVYPRPAKDTVVAVNRRSGTSTSFRPMWCRPIPTHAPPS
jgi:hypothetical protein